MNKHIKPILPWAAVLAALASTILFLGILSQRQHMLVNSGETRPVAENAVKLIAAGQPNSLDDADFRRAVEALPGKAYIASAWLFDANGQIVARSGMMVPKEGTAAEHATGETLRLLESVPPDALTGEQRTLLLVASAIQSEGEHNDVLHHLVCEIRTPDGILLGWIGIAYDINPAASTPNAAWVISLLAWLFFMGVYWFSLPLWVWLDARQRGERAGVWAMFVLIGNLVALMAYILTRPPPPAA